MSESGESHIYKPVLTREIKAPRIESNKSTKPPFEAGGPQKAIVSVGEPGGTLLEKIGLGRKAKNPQRYAKLSKYHGRATIDALISRRVIWGGELPGDIYGARDWKGNVMENITVAYAIEEDRTSRYGLRVLGLKDKVGINRIERVSKILRTNGLPTEFPRETRKIEEVVIRDKVLSPDRWKKVPIDGWKRQVLDWSWKHAQKHRKGGYIDDAINAEKKWRDTKEYLEDTDFYIVQRDIQVDERIRDLEATRSSDEFRKLVEPVFKWINVVIDTKHSGLIGGTSAPEKFQFNKKDITRYFEDWLPTQMGIYLAKLHKLGLSHGWTHSQNWSLVGTLYDLDSVSGLPGDEKPSKEDYMRDVIDTVTTLFRLAVPTKYTDHMIMVGVQTSFITSYLKERFGLQTKAEETKNVIAEYFDSIMSVFPGKDPGSEYNWIWNEVKDKVTNNLNHWRPSSA